MASIFSIKWEIAKRKGGKELEFRGEKKLVIVVLERERSSLPGLLGELRALSRFVVL